MPGPEAARKTSPLPQTPITTAMPPATAVARNSLRIIEATSFRYFRPRGTTVVVGSPGSPPPFLGRSGRPRTPRGKRSVRRELVGPELSPDLSDLVAALLALRIRGEQMILATVLEHLERLDGGLPEELDRGDVLVVLAAQGGWREQGAHPVLGPPIHGERLLHPPPQLLALQILRLVEDLAETRPHGAALDVAVNRPQGADVLLLLGGQGRPGGHGGALERWRRRATRRRFAAPCEERDT